MTAPRQAATARPTITAFDWVPDFAKGQVRDLRARWALEEVGQPYDVRYLAQGAQKAPDHRARNPFGQVPTYVEGDLVLFESGAILLHIAETRSGLLPDDPAGRARAAQWMFGALNTVEPPLTDWAIAAFFERDQPWSAARRPTIEQRVHERLGELAGRLGDGDWLDGDFSAGDLLMIAVLRMAKSAGMLDRYPTLTDYVARGEARPAFQRALDAQLAGFTGTPPPELVEWERRFKEGETQ